MKTHATCEQIGKTCDITHACASVTNRGMEAGVFPTPLKTASRSRIPGGRLNKFRYLSFNNFANIVDAIACTEEENRDFLEKQDPSS